MFDPQLEVKWSTNLLFFLIILKVFLEGKWPISMWGMMYHGNHFGVSIGLDLLLWQTGW